MRSETAPSTEAVNLEEDPEKEKQTEDCLVLGGGLEKEAVAVVFIVCTLIRESKNNDACDADLGTRPCSFSQARQPWEPLIEWHTRSTASITKPRAGQPFLRIKYVRDDKNLPSMGSGGNKKIHNGVGAGGRGKLGGFCKSQPRPWGTGYLKDRGTSPCAHPTHFTFLFVCFSFCIQPTLPFLPRSPPPKLPPPHFEAEMKALCCGCRPQSSRGTAEVCFSLRRCIFLPRKRGEKSA